MSADIVARKINGLKEAAQEVRIAPTTNARHEALMIFDHCLDIDNAFPTYGKNHISAWAG
ncbi:hypothetical protein FRC01_006888, partial [Tulasnella sp. 417]